MPVVGVTGIVGRLVAVGGGVVVVVVVVVGVGTCGLATEPPCG